MDRLVLIDGDILVYRAGFAVERTVYLCNGVRYDLPLTEVKSLLKKEGLTSKQAKLTKRTEIEPLSHALQTINTILWNIQKSVFMEGSQRHYKIYLTANDKSNFRYTLAKTKPYKGNRKAPKPYHYHDLREFLVKNYNAEIIHGIEADDAIGIEAMKHPGTIIASIDKDLMMIPSINYNFVTGKFTKVSDPGAITLSENNRKLTATGIFALFAQMLQGDNADNIPGICGLGPVGIFNLLKDCKTVEDAYQVVYTQYKKRQIEDRFSEVANLLFIRRKENQTFEDYCDENFIKED